MAITNPDKVVTKQDLADFYEEIFPYLGGMPEMVANKFSKGDLYSTAETMIGRWFDGKPLYQKCFQIKNMPKNTALVVEHGISNIGTIKDAFGFCRKPDGKCFMIPSAQADGTISIDVAAGTYTTAFRVRTSGMADGVQIETYEGEVVIRYTKSTDAITSIGNDTDYSTSEKIVGTWIDGKPLYQKTIPITLPTCTTDGAEVSTSFAIGASIDVVVDAKVLYLQDGKWTALFANNGNTSRFIRFLVQTNAFSTVADRNKIRIGNAAKTASGCTGYATIQYTKTT